MVRNPVGGLQPEELPERKRIRAPPFDPALAVDPLEIPDHVHAEVPARWHRGCAHRAGVVRLAGALHEAVEPGLPPAPLASGRRTRDPASAAFRTTSPSGRPDDLPADPSPQPDSDPLSPLNRVRPRPLRQRADRLDEVARNRARTRQRSSERYIAGPRCWATH